MPVVSFPSMPGPPPAGLIFSEFSATASVNLALPDCRWWLIIPERPDLSVPLELVMPSAGAGSLPTGDAAFAAERDVAEGVFRAFGRRTAIVTHGDMQGLEIDVAVLFKGEAAWDAFETARESFLGALLQSDQAGRQWWVDLGEKAPYALPQLRTRPTEPQYVVALHLIEVDAA